MTRVWIAALAGALTLGGCSMFSGGSRDAEPAAEAVDIAEQARGGLPGQRLELGECGLFLWTRGVDPTFVFFQRGGATTALALLSDQEKTVTQTAVGGSLFGEFMTEQTFSVPGESYSVQLSFEPGEEMDGGQRVSEGLIRMTTAEGWDVMQPVAGVRACRTN